MSETAVEVREVAATGRRVSVTARLCALTAAGSCALALAAASSVSIPVENDLGLAPLLPLGYWLGLAMLGVSFAIALVREPDRAWLHGLLLGCLLLSVYGAAAVAADVPRGEVSWRHIGIADVLTSTGRIDPDIDAYFSWPGFFALLAHVSEATGISLVHLALWAPVWNMVLWLGALAWLLRALTADTRRIWLALWLFTLGNWIDQDYLSPQALGFFCYLVVVGLVLHHLDTRGRRAPNPGPAQCRQFAVMAAVLLAACLVATHQLTPFMLLVALTGLTVVGRSRAVNLPLVLMIMLACWLAYPASAYLAGHPVLMVETDAVAANLNDRLEGTPGHLLANQIRMALTASMWGLATIGAFLDRRTGGLDRRVVLLAVCPFVLVPVQPYGGEMLMRAALFALPFVAYLGAGAVLALARPAVARMVAVAGLCLLLAVGSVTARYANARFDIPTMAEIRASRVLYQLAPEGTMLIAGARPTPWRYRGYASYKYRTVTDLCEAGMTASACVDVVLGEVDRLRLDGWVLLSRANEESVNMQGQMSRSMFREFERQMRSHEEVSLRYVNKDVRIYHISGPLHAGTPDRERWGYAVNVSRGQVLEALAPAACAALVLSGLAPAPVHAVLALLVVMVLPGWALTRNASLDPLGRIVVSVGMSFAVTVLISLVLFYAQMWVWQAAFAMVAAVATVPALLALAKERAS